jgi:hypothetical protein
MLPLGVAEVVAMVPCEAVVMVEVVVVMVMAVAVAVARCHAKFVVRHVTLPSVVIRGLMQIIMGNRSTQ